MIANCEKVHMLIGNVKIKAEMVRENGSATKALKRLPTLGIQLHNNGEKTIIPKVDNAESPNDTEFEALGSITIKAIIAAPSEERAYERLRDANESKPTPPLRRP